jgi:hypothetical protein
MGKKVADQEKEIWKKIENYEGWYSISNLGRVRRDKNVCGTTKNKIIKQGFTIKNPYPNVTLSKYCKTKTLRVHKIVAKHFLSNPLNLPQINHKDGNKLNNSVKNLEYVTRSQNTIHAYKNGLLKNHLFKLKTNQVLDIRKIYETKKYSYKDIGIMFNTSGENIRYIINRKTWKYV